MDLLSSGLIGDSYYGLSSLFSVVGVFTGFFFNIVLLMLLGLMLYFFTGENKPGASVVSNLMSFGLRMNCYLWMLVGSLLGFFGIQQIVHYIFNKILPEGDSYLYEDLESRVFVNGLVLLLVGALLLTLNYFVVRMIESQEEKAQSVVVKVLVTFGLVFFSAAFALSTYLMLNDWINNLYDDADFISSSTIGYFVASLMLWALFVKKALWIYNREGEEIEVDVVVVEE